MKKLFLTLAVILAGSSIANAQLFIGGQLSVGSLSSDKVTETVTTPTETLTADYNPSHTFSFGIAPKIGYMLNDKMAVGAFLGFDMTTQKNPYDDYGHFDAEGTHKFTNFGGGVFFRYYLINADKFSFYGEAQVGIKLGTENDTYVYTDASKTVTVDKKGPKSTTLGIGIIPGISYKLNDHFALDANFDILSLGFEHSKQTYKEEDGNEKYEYSSINNNLGLRVNNGGISVGFHYNF